MREVGGDYSYNTDSLRSTHNNVRTYLNNFNLTLFDYGRSAIRSIPNDKNRKVLLPEYICESVTECYEKSQIEFYRINEDTSIDFEDLCVRLCEDVGTLFLAHYYGAIQDKEKMGAIVKKAHEHGIIVVEDVTQSMFSGTAYLGDYIVGSIRKWMMVPQGAFLVDRIGNVDISEYAISNDNSRLDAMKLKDRFLKTGDNVKDEYRKLFAICEEGTDRQAVPKLMSEKAIRIMDSIDVAEIIERRRDNYEYLLSKLDKMGIAPIVKLGKNDCPLTLPIRIEKNRDEFRRYLIDNNIFCPVHWPMDGVQIKERPMAVRNADTVLSLVIDQRYEREDMDYMADIISKYEGEL